jgi:hypothetical protein
MEHPADDGDDGEGLDTNGELNLRPDVGDLADELAATQEELRETREKLERLAEHVHSVEEGDEPDEDDEGLELGREP